jgi:hypothetical protein
MKLRAIAAAATIAALALSGCDAKHEEPGETKMGDVGRGSTKPGTAGGGTLSTGETHRAEVSDGSTTASQGTTGTATVTTKM